MINGIIVINKEKGYTSHDVVARLRGILHTKKIGHTGTLDPMAEGVLPVCVGNATKLCDMLSGGDKEYEAVMLLGSTYDTLDVTGTLLEKREVMSTEEEIAEAVRSFIGGYDQVPPMYSAKKVDGKKLYDLARSGVTIERKPVFVNIYDICILFTDLPRVGIRVRCGKGTYIRSLIDDIGRKLGCGASMESLVRTASGEYSINNAYLLSDIEKAMEEDKISDVITTLDEVFADLPRFDASPSVSKLVRNGNVLDGRTVRAAGEDLKMDGGGMIRVYDAADKLCGIYEYKIADDIFKPYKMFLSP
ncbi:MAG: tRNA pseudouridine(55) synthase TruB [Lachnospiraceae bacterium]|nr:tRNA pseudouridine(55) synthase TruB [Lachnospiraceae bacterium]